MKKLSLLLFLFTMVVCWPSASAAGYCYELINPDGNGDDDIAYFSWNTEANGNITVWITGVPGNTETAFRNNGMAAGDFAVAGSDITFSHSINAEKTKITLTPSAALTNGAEIIYNAVIEYRTSTTTAPYDNLWPTISFIFTYGEECAEIVPTQLEKPTSLAIGTGNILTFYSDPNAGSNTVTVYRESSLLPVYVQTNFSSGDVLNFTDPGSYSISVQSLTASLYYVNSEASLRLPVTIPGEPVIPAAGPSEYCDYMIGSGVDAALLTWEIADGGGIIITMSGVDGDAGTMFRAPGMNAANFMVNSYSGDWFDAVLSADNTEITLTPKIPLINGDIITYSGYVEYTTSAGKALWPLLSFTYTYGNTCVGAPSVSVSPASITFSPTEGVQSFTLTGENLTGAITLEAPLGLSVSPESITPAVDGTIASTTVTVKWEKGNSSGGSVKISGGGLVARKEVLVSSSGFSSYCNYLLPNGSIVENTRNNAYMTVNVSDDMKTLEFSITPYYSTGTATWIDNAACFRISAVTVNGELPSVEPIRVVNSDMASLTFDQPLAEGDVVTFGGAMVWTTDYSVEGFEVNTNCFVDAAKSYTVGESCDVSVKVLSVKFVGEATEITESSAKTAVTVTTGDYPVTQIKFKEDAGKVTDIVLNKTGSNTYLLEGLTANTSYSFTVTAIDSEGNESEAYASKLVFQTQTTTSAGEIGNRILRLSPLPAKDILTISGIGTPVAISLMNLQGSIVLQIANSNTVDVSGLSAGLYIIRITDGQGNQYLEKVLIQ